MKKEKIITGNWNYFQSNGAYAEVYFDSKFMNFYEYDIGLRSQIKYLIIKDSIYINNKNTEQYKNLGKLFFKNNNILVIENANDTSYLYRIDKKQFTIDKLKNKDDESIYLIEFHKRKNLLLSTIPDGADL